VSTKSSGEKAMRGAMLMILVTDNKGMEG